MNANLSLTLSIILNSYMRCIFIVRLNTDLYCPLLKAKPYILRASACDMCLDATCPCKIQLNGIGLMVLTKSYC